MKKRRPIAEGSQAKRVMRQILLANARLLLRDGASNETWRKHVQAERAALVNAVGEAELEHIWAVAQVGPEADDDGEDVLPILERHLDDCFTLVELLEED